jgi:hypothetical protein
MHREDVGCSADVSEILTVSIVKAKWLTLRNSLRYPLDRRLDAPHVFSGIRTSIVQPVARS